MYAHFQGKQRTLWGRGKLPLAPLLLTHVHRIHIHTHTHCPSLHVTINQLAPTCCLQTEFPTDVLRRVGWEKERKVELEAGEGEGGRGNLKELKTLPCQTANSPRLSPTPLNPAKQQLDIFHPSRERQRQEDIPMIPFCMPNRELRCRGVALRRPHQREGRTHPFCIFFSPLLD